MLNIFWLSLIKTYCSSQILILIKQYIDASLYKIIKNELHELLHAEILSGVDVKHSPSLYYTSIETISLKQTYSNAIHLLTQYCTADVQSEARLFSLSSTKSNQYKKYVDSDMTLNIGRCSKKYAVIR
ncbi:MAG: hypothetical protein ACI9N9_000791 [Enterobacterales bacterium]|jgi:hypothetical protein